MINEQATNGSIVDFNDIKAVTVVVLNVMVIFVVTDKTKKGSGGAFIYLLLAGLLLSYRSTQQILLNPAYFAGFFF